MPAANSKTEAIERLRILLAVLAADWQDRDAIIECAAVYPDAIMSARAMFRADMRALLALGFQVERTEGHHDPQWRLVGHERFGAEVRTKWCPRCKTWRHIDKDFTANKAESSGKMVYCRYCNRGRVKEWLADHPDEAAAQVRRGMEARKEWQRKFPERARERWRRDRRKKNANNG